MRSKKLKGYQSYKQTKIDESKGEEWFCSEDEAKSAGWRKGDYFTIENDTLKQAKPSKAVTALINEGLIVLKKNSQQRKFLH